MQVWAKLSISLALFIYLFLANNHFHETIAFSFSRVSFILINHYHLLSLLFNSGWHLPRSTSVRLRKAWATFEQSCLLCWAQLLSWQRVTRKLTADHFCNPSFCVDYHQIVCWTALMTKGNSASCSFYLHLQYNRRSKSYALCIWLIYINKVSLLPHL